MSNILVVGTVAFDSIESPFGKKDRIIGGAGTYICWSASNFVQNIQLSSVVGDDFPDAEIKALNKRGVDTEGLDIKKGEKSFYWAGRYHDNMNQRDTLVTELNVLEDFNPLLPVSYKDAEYVMLGNLTPAVQLAVLAQLNAPKLVILDTMNFWIDIALDDLKEVFKKVDILTINDEEARMLSGEYSLISAAEKILEMGPKFLIIKKGEHGALLFDPTGKMFYAPAMPLKSVMDPTGAGDSFAGGLIGHLASKNEVTFETVKEAIVYGSATASFCVEEFGLDRLKQVTKSDIDTRVQKFKNLVSF